MIGALYTRCFRVFKGARTCNNRARVLECNSVWCYPVYIMQSQSAVVCAYCACYKVEGEAQFGPRSQDKTFSEVVGEYMSGNPCTTLDCQSNSGLQSGGQTRRGITEHHS